MLQAKCETSKRVNVKQEAVKGRSLTSMSMEGEKVDVCKGLWGKPGTLDMPFSSIWSKIMDPTRQCTVSGSWPGVPAPVSRGNGTPGPWVATCTIQRWQMLCLSSYGYSPGLNMTKFISKMLEKDRKKLLLKRHSCMERKRCLMRTFSQESREF